DESAGDRPAPLRRLAVLEEPLSARGHGVRAGGETEELERALLVRRRPMIGLRDQPRAGAEGLPQPDLDARDSSTVGAAHDAADPAGRQRDVEAELRGLR